MKYSKYIFTLLFIFLMKISYAGGFLIIDPNNKNNSRIPHRVNPYIIQHKSLNVSVYIKDQYAKTTVKQVFYNPTNVNLEAWFIFPVPKGVVIKNFSMEINGKKMQAELLDAAKARKIYEDIVRKLKDPALLEYSGQKLFKVRIFPVEARKEKKIEISYTQILEKDNNTEEYLFPLNTKKYSAKPLKNLSFKIDIESTSKIKTIYSPSHKMEVIRKSENKAVVGFEASSLKSNIDLKLFIGFDKSKIGVSILDYKLENEDGFFLLNISPGKLSSSNKIINKDISFVLDVSGSMAGEKMTQAKKALSFCINNLNKGDKFEIVKFSTEAQALFGKRVVANAENIKKAQDFINKLRAIGGTNIDEAIGLACKEKKSVNRPNMIVFITDGKPTIGETSEDKLLKQVKESNSENTRIFTFGIGDNINTHLLDKITEETNAYRTYINPNEDIEIKVSNFFTKVSSPILTDVKISFEGSVRAKQMYPKKTPDIFKGSSITLLGKYEKTGSTKIILSGKVNGKDEKYTYPIKFTKSNKNDFIPPLWAARKIGYLLDEIRLHGESEEVKDEIVALAKKYGIITPYTSYLILEDEEINITNNNIRPSSTIFKNRFADEEKFRSKTKEEYGNLNKKAGRSSVVSSNEVQGLGQANTTADQMQGSSRMMYYDKKGKKQNLSTQVINIQGRAVYQKQDKWIDLYVQNYKGNITKIQFATVLIISKLETTPRLSLSCL